MTHWDTVLAALAKPPSPDRVRYWQARRTRLGELGWPDNWSDRVAGWMAGGVFRLDWSWPANLGEGPIAPEASSVTVYAEDPALLVPWGPGQIGVFSHRAVAAYLDLWRLYRWRRIFGMPRWVNWANEVPGYSDTLSLYPLPSPLAGFWAAGNPAGRWLFHPAVLGPVLVETEDGWHVAPDCDWAYEAGRLKLRGERIVDGMWTAGRLNPVGGEGGWFVWSVPPEAWHALNIKK